MLKTIFLMLAVTSSVFAVDGPSPGGDGGGGGGGGGGPGPSICSKFTNPNDCFLSDGTTKCFWRPDFRVCAGLPPTRGPTSADNPCKDLTEAACKESDKCLWVFKDDEAECKLPPNGPPPPGAVQACFSMTQTDCENARQCRWIDEVNVCRPAPPRNPCPSLDRENAERCARLIRAEFEHDLNITRKAMEGADDGDRHEIEHKLWCGNATISLYNVTRFCVKKCFDDDDEFYGLPDIRTWAKNFFNNTDISTFLQKFSCDKSTGDEVIAQGLADNSEMQSVLSPNMASFVAVSSMVLGFVSVLILAVTL